jgi:hypothetical protein
MTKENRMALGTVTMRSSGQVLTLVSARRRNLSAIKRIVVANLALVSVQALTAGFLMSGSVLALRFHSGVGFALELGALVQALTAATLRRRRHVSSILAIINLVLFVLVVLQVGVGFRRLYWLHVPIGVGLFGGLIRQCERLDNLLGAEGPQGNVAATTTM